VFNVDKRGLELVEVAPGWLPENISDVTNAQFEIASNIKEFELL